MDPTLEQTKKRAKRILTVEKLLRDNEVIDMNKFEIIICEQFICSVRTAREYIKIAQSRIK